ncbi:MAG: hypothetical protein WD271_14465 [Acidimicrobiia bacterium]
MHDGLHGGEGLDGDERFVCAWVLDASPGDEPDVEGVAQQVVDVADGTRTKAMGIILAAGFTDHARLLLDGMTRDTQPLPINMRLDATGNNKLLRDQNRTCKMNAATAALNKLMGGHGGTQRNVFRALDALASHVSGLTTPTIDVLLFSNMENTDAALNMTDATVLSSGATAMLSTATAAGLIPNCKGWQIYVIGAGTNDPGTPLTDAQANTIRDFWSRLFAQCGPGSSSRTTPTSSPSQ